MGIGSTDISTSTSASTTTSTIVVLATIIITTSTTTTITVAASAILLTSTTTTAASGQQPTPWYRNGIPPALQPLPAIPEAGLQQEPLAHRPPTVDRMGKPLQKQPQAMPSGDVELMKWGSWPLLSPEGEIDEQAAAHNCATSGGRHGGYGR